MYVCALVHRAHEAESFPPRTAETSSGAQATLDGGDRALKVLLLRTCALQQLSDGSLRLLPGSIESITTKGISTA